MAYASVTIKDLVERSVNHKWSIPEFQRGVRYTRIKFYVLPDIYRAGMQRKGIK